MITLKAMLAAVFSKFKLHNIPYPFINFAVVFKVVVVHSNSLTLELLQDL